MTDITPDAILAIIKGRTAANPIPLIDLATEVGIGERHVKRLIQSLRRAGEPIAVSRSRNNGYYWDICGQEAAKLRAEGLSRLVTAHRMDSQQARELAGQERLI